MTISKATKILDYYFDEKTKHHEGIFSLEKSFYTDYLPFGEEISKLVDEIMDKGKTTSELLSKYFLDLEEFGIKTENNECSFIDTVEDLGKKVSKLCINLNIEEDYVICHKLKIHYRRYKKLMN